jgi:uncharacterized protein (DUF488 family)
MRTIFRAHLRTLEAQAELDQLRDLAAGGTRLCLLCFEADPEHCHRTLVIGALAALLPLEVLHLRPADAEP